MLIKELINIPETVDKGQFVLKLTEGVNKAQEPVDSYVVTDQLVECFRDSLNFIKGAVESNTSKAAYLHGSFGSGKSHFMAILNRTRPSCDRFAVLTPIQGQFFVRLGSF